jgi:GDP-L-fucose synthase
MKKILITGGNGYIAKSLYNTLKNKYDVISITRQDFDLTDQFETSKYFSNKYFDVVIHCAVSGGSRLKQETWRDMDDNLKMYYNLLNCRNRFNKLIHFGSGAETNAPESPYGLSKRVIANSISEQDNFYNIKIFGVFDENELDTRFIKANIKRYIAKEPMQINENKFMDFFYMQDLVKVIEYYINEQEPPKEFDCVYIEGSPTLTQLSLIINDLDEHKVKIFVGNPDGDSYTSKYRSELPIEFIGLEEGIKQVYNKLK